MSITYYLLNIVTERNFILLRLCAYRWQVYTRNFARFPHNGMPNTSPLGRMSFIFVRPWDRHSHCGGAHLRRSCNGLELPEGAVALVESQARRDSPPPPRGER
jgi:hypothetical protein